MAQTPQGGPSPKMATEPGATARCTRAAPLQHPGASCRPGAPAVKERFCLRRTRRGVARLLWRDDGFKDKTIHLRANPRTAPNGRKRSRAEQGGGLRAGRERKDSAAQLQGLQSGARGGRNQSSTRSRQAGSRCCAARTAAAAADGVAQHGWAARGQRGRRGRARGAERQAGAQGADSQQRPR